VPVPVLISDPPTPPLKPPSAITPAKLVEFAEPTVSAKLPSATVEPATPARSLIVWPVPLPEMSKLAPAPTRFTPLDAAMLPGLSRARIAPPAIVVGPV
jgi:hypothetical protein